MAKMQDGAVFSPGSNACLGQMTATVVEIDEIGKQTEKKTHKYDKFPFFFFFFFFVSGS